MNNLHDPPCARINKHDLVVHHGIPIGNVTIFGRHLIILDTLWRQDHTYGDRSLVSKRLRVLFDHILLEPRPFLNSDETIDATGYGSHGASDNAADRACSIIPLLGTILRPWEHALGIG